MATMNNNENYEIRWEVIDPQGRHVVLKQTTYEKHIVADHTQEDAIFRRKIELQAQKAIINPQLIIAKEQRHEYHSLARVPFEENIDKLKHINVIVDADRDPNEVVTFIASSNVRGTLEAGSIIYEN